MSFTIYAQLELNSREGPCGISALKTATLRQNHPWKLRSQAVPLTRPRWPPVCLWKLLYLEQMTHRGNWCVVLLCCCCSIVANLHLSFLLPSDLYLALPTLFFPLLYSLLSSISPPPSAIFLFPTHFLSASSLPFCSAYVCPSFFPYFSPLHLLISRCQSVAGPLARLPAFTTCLLCVRTCTTGSNKIPRMCVSSPAR